MENSNVVYINIDKIGESVNTIVSNILVAKSYPPCLGKAFPFLIEKDIPISIKNHTDHSSESSSDSIPLNSVLSNPALEAVQDRVLSKEGIKVITEIKKSVATKHTDQLINCLQCEYFERCDALTKNYAQAVSLRLFSGKTF